METFPNRHTIFTGCVMWHIASLKKKALNRQQNAAKLTEMTKFSQTSVEPEKENHMLPSSVACDVPLTSKKLTLSKGQEKYEKHCLNGPSAISGSTVFLKKLRENFL